MNLNVTIRSVVGRGTTITVAGIPLAEKPAVALPARRGAGPTPIDGFKILLVEDDPIVLSATATLLEKWGCTVLQATGIPRDGGDDCDLIITDFDLGDKTTGSDCIAEIRSRAKREIPAIIMTGHDPDRVRALLGERGQFILSKPVRPAELRSILVAQKFKALRTASKPTLAAFNAITLPETGVKS